MKYDKIIESAAGKFGAWKLPKNFSPDSGIEFAPLTNKTAWPRGTNLFLHDQAKEMFDYCLREVFEELEISRERVLGDAKRYADVKVFASKGRAEDGEVEGAWHDLKQSLRFISE